MDQLGITFVILVLAIAMMFVKRTEKIGWWLRRLDVELLARPLVPLPGRSGDWEASLCEAGVGVRLKV